MNPIVTLLSQSFQNGNREYIKAKKTAPRGILRSCFLYGNQSAIVSSSGGSVRSSGGSSSSLSPRSVIIGTPMGS